MYICINVECKFEYIRELNIIKHNLSIFVTFSPRNFTFIENDNVQKYLFAIKCIVCLFLKKDLKVQNVYQDISR